MFGIYSIILFNFNREIDSLMIGIEYLTCILHFVLVYDNDTAINGFFKRSSFTNSTLDY